MVADKNYGIVSQVIGSTLDAKFSEDQLPKIYNALNVELERTVLGETFKETLWCEVAQHLGGGRIRAIALGSTDHPHVGMLALRNSKAMGAIAAGRRLTLGAVHRLRQAQGQRHLANVGRADQQIGVGQPPLGQAGLKLLEDMVLTVDLPHESL